MTNTTKTYDRTEIFNLLKKINVFHNPSTPILSQKICTVLTKLKLQNFDYNYIESNSNKNTQPITVEHFFNNDKSIIIINDINSHEPLYFFFKSGNQYAVIDNFDYYNFTTKELLYKKINSIISNIKGISIKVLCENNLQIL